MDSVVPLKSLFHKDVGDCPEYPGEILKSKSFTVKGFQDLYQTIRLYAYP